MFLKNEPRIMGLDSVELLLGVEEAFDIELSDDEASAIVTVGDLHNCLVRKWEAKPKDVRRNSREPTWQALCDVIVDQLAVGPDQVTPNARIVKDLRID